MSIQLARMTQNVINGEVVSVRLDVIAPDARVHLTEGDAFYTVEMKVDPWEVQP
jgi:hypothetical protein